MVDAPSFYPPAPKPGDNAFGNFEFGVSSFGAFGDLPPFDWLLTVASQYANSPILLSVLQSFNDAMDQTQNFDNFYDWVWNVASAQGYGLDVWGRIVGVSRNLQVADTTWFGFVQGVPGTDSFGPGGVSPFFSGQSLTSNYALTDQAYRQLIMAKAAYNICNGSIPAINSVMMGLFGRGNPFGPGGDCYCTDDGDMTMTYTFKFLPSPVESSIIFNSGVLPKPVGVAASVVISP